MSRAQQVCPNGHPMDPSWKVCPYCRGAAAPSPASTPELKKTVREVAPGVPEAPPSAPPRKTSRLEPQQEAMVGWIVDIDGRQKGQDFRIPEGRVVVGGGDECDIRLDNDFASELHASLRYQDGEYTLTDLDSTNGTKVNGEEVARRVLADGDRIQIGTTTYIFKGLYLRGGAS